MNVLATVFADGTYAKPLCIMKGKLVGRQWLQDTDDQATIFMSEGGGTTAEAFMAYAKWFVEEYKTNERRESKWVLIADNLGAHKSRDVVDFLRQNNVVLLCLYANSTHFMQPLDVAVFRPFKMALHKEITNVQAKCGSKGCKIPKRSYCSIIVAAMKKSFTEDTIKSGFAKTHLYPFSAQGMKNYATPHLTKPGEDMAEVVKEWKRELGRDKDARKYMRRPGPHIDIKEYRDTLVGEDENDPNKRASLRPPKDCVVTGEVLQGLIDAADRKKR